ncbi:NAD(+)/NADH kinase [Alloacidobacterium dinghuense]|uniref:NAD(+)/NADH kinase n=1 Tax=Alloacidobacterium dinghuense TaxID=2763107 RepID=A0A7G8BDH2_9BACT|nr:diacylglycerol kinase family protein [Alloacidobacterium dinghuense]QNI30592.1 NAD(+)/NADH kinase [Alloacidobacterium dinghuense]
MRRILLLANPLFESLNGSVLPRILRVFEQAGGKVEVLETGAERAAGGKAKRAVEQGVDAIIVAGGDGTVFDVLQGVAGSDIPLGILPFGTGNVLAQNLKIPKNPAEAARWLLAAKPRLVPLGRITCCTSEGKRSWFFAMAAGMGVHAAMMEVARRNQKDRTGRLAYFSAGARVLFSHPVQPFKLKITTVEGEVLERSASEMIAVRVAELNLWRPGASLDFPFLRLASVEGASRRRLAQASFQALFLGAGQRERRQTDRAAARYEDVLRVECAPIPGITYDVPIAVEADGEILGASCATIEMANVSVRLLSHPVPAA